MFRLSRVSKLRHTFFNTFWTKAVSHLEKRLRHPSKRLRWKMDDLDNGLKNVEKIVSVQKLSPSEKSDSFPRITRKTCKSVTNDGKYRGGHSMTLRPRKKPPIKIVALDPGVRTFQTAYDSNNNVIEFGNNDIYSNIDASTIKKIHTKIISYLCKNYNLVLIPRLIIPHSTDPYLDAWDHPAFVDKLFAHAKKCHVRCKIIEVEESWTSKTCSGCGKINNPGRSKIYECSRCDLVIDRDINGARNILLKNMDALKIELK